MGKSRDLNPHFLRRERDGSARIRLKFTAAEASLIEEAAGETPVATYIHRAVQAQARRHVEEARTRRTKQLNETERLEDE